MRVVLDTNVLVSAFLRPQSISAKILRLILQKDLQIVLDERVLSEYKQVLSRPKFCLPQDKVEVILEHLRIVSIISPALTSKVNLPDPDDEPFLEVAIAGRANAIITGNKRHYPAKICKEIKVITPTEFFKTQPLFEP